MKIEKLRRLGASWVTPLLLGLAAGAALFLATTPI